MGVFMSYLMGILCLFLCSVSFSATETLSLSGAAISNENSTSASENKSNLKLNEALTNKKFNENEDITDAKIKADSGSLSTYSLKFNLSYYGPTLGQLDGKDQPNLDGSVGTYETSLGGSLGLRYRLDSKSSLSFGTGLKVIHPLHGAERTDIQTPYLNYDSTFRLGGVQMRSSPGLSVTTLPNYTQVGQVGSITYDFNSIYNIPSSRFAVGLDANLSLFIYNRNYEPADKKSSRGAVQLYPTFKYNLSDKTSITTSTSLSWLSPRYRSNETILLNRTVSQRLGVGHAFTRDVYVYPYLTVYPSRLASDTTTFNLSTTFSLL